MRMGYSGSVNSNYSRVAVCSAAVLVLGGSVSVCGASVFSGTEVICGAAVFSGSGVAVITTGASLSSDGSLLLF